MNTEDTAWHLFCAAVAALATGAATFDMTRNYYRNSAVDAGVAEWAVDKRGATSFHWITNRPATSSQIAVCPCKYVDSTTILPHYGPTNYVVPPQSFPYQWTGTNIMLPAL